MHLPFEEIHEHKIHAFIAHFMLARDLWDARNTKSLLIKKRGNYRTRNRSQSSGPL